MGSFWGLNNAGKEAQGWPREWGAWGRDRATNTWIPRSDDAYGRGADAADWYKNWNVNRAAQGVGGIADLRDLGSQIMPGVNDYISNRAGRIQGQIDEFGRLPGAADTMAQINAATDEKGNLIRQTRDYALSDVGDTFHRAWDTEQGAHDYNMGDFEKRYGKLIDDTTSEFAGLRQQNRDTYGGLKTSAEDTYSQQLSDIEKLNPASEFAQARTARSFAPQMASTAARLRRAGLGTDSPQAFSAMQRVESARARAQDDAAATGTESYVKARAGALTGRQGARERLGVGEFSNEADLARQGLAMTTGLSTEQGAGLRGEMTRNAGARQAIDLDRSKRAIGIQDTAYGRAADWEDERGRNALTNKALHTQDWQTRGDLNSQLSDAEREAIGLRQSEYNAGLGYRTADLAERNAGAAGVGQYGTQMMNFSLPASQQAMQWGNDAMDAYKTAYGYEAPNAGWGLKMLTNMGVQALGAIPKVGPLIQAGVQPAVSGVQNANAAQGVDPTRSGGGGGYGSPYGGGYSSQYPGTPPFLPSGTQPGQAGQPNYSGTGGWQNLFQMLGGMFGKK